MERWQCRKEDGSMIEAATAEELKEKIGHKYIFQENNGDLYVDGSCEWPRHKTAARAAWGIVQINEKQEIVASGQGTVGGNYRQHSVEGEHHGMLQGLVHAKPGVDIQCDCAAVIAHSRKPHAVAAGPRNIVSYRRQRVKQTRQRGHRHSIVNIKAHRTAEGLEEMIEKERNGMQNVNWQPKKRSLLSGGGR